MNKIDELTKRIEALEEANDITQNNFSLIREVLYIFNEIPIFQLIVRRALNRRELNTLKNVILPRRQKRLKAITNMHDVPKQIKNTFIEEEGKLLKTTKNSIRHRQSYEFLMIDKIKKLFFNLTA